MANLEEEIWNQLVRESPDIATRLANSKLHEDRATVLRRFEDMLQNDELAESDWQIFLKKTHGFSDTVFAIKY